MKKLLLVFLILLLTVVTLCSCNVQGPFTLQYAAGAGGVISGQAEQTVNKGNDGEAVVAVPDEGYEFVKWSDNVTTATRQDKKVKRDISVTAEFKKTDNTAKTYTITYLVEEGGWLTGEAVQKITGEIYGTDVIVHVQDGYEFIGWSDGSTKTQRWDYHDHQDKTFTAKIRRINDYKLMNWYTEFGVGVPTVTINKDTVDTLSFPVPTREHYTFNGWYLGDTLVGDEQGNSLFTRELLDDGNRDIVAKWTANETFTYKILLVYITRIDATLPVKELSSSETVHLIYSMSSLEREYCHWTTVRLKEYLDTLTNGLVDFQIDEFFTTKTYTTDDFRKTTTGYGIIDNTLYPNHIAEINNIIQNYDSALTVLNLSEKLHGATGIAAARYGQVYFDYVLKIPELCNVTFEQTIDYLKNYKINDSIVASNGLANFTECWLDTFAHELAHTIEWRINGDDYHTFSVGNVSGSQSINDYYKSKYYYLHEILYNYEKVGIPYEFWTGNIMKVRYDVQEIGVGYGGGYIRGKGYYTKDTAGAVHCIYDVPYGYHIPTVTAVAYDGYEFVEWSDGVKTATRTDTNITEDKTITAIFRPIVYELTVVSGEGGRIVVGEGVWTLQHNQSKSLKAVANEGYIFVGWSDGKIDDDRIFTLNSYELSLFDENKQYTITALFKKIGEESDYYILNFTQSEGGRYLINGSLKNSESILMEKDKSVLQVIVSANVGYRFIRWSDGSTEQERTFVVNEDLIALSDENNNITIYAIFEKIE